MGRMKEIHETKTIQDLILVDKKRSDMETFRETERQESPIADRLEEISKGEISRWIEEIDLRSEALNAASEEYQVSIYLK